MILIGLAIDVLIGFLLLSRRARRRIAGRWGRWQTGGRYVSNRQFLENCSVENAYIALTVRATISEALGIDEHEIHPNDRLLDDLCS